MLFAPNNVIIFHINDERFLDLRSDKLQEVVTGSQRGYSMQSIIKSLLYQMYDYAMENDLVMKNYAQYIVICEKEKKLNREVFTDDEISYGLNKLCIKRILGHESDDITDKVYTHKDIAELLNEINKIP